MDPLPRLTVRTGDATVDAMAADLQARSRYVQADATQQLDTLGEFDLVVCDNVIDHSQEPAAILREARRLVAPGGRLLFGVNVFSTLGIAKWRYVTRKLHPSATNVLCHPQSFVEPSLRAMVSACGWSVSAWSGASSLQRHAGKAYRVRLVASPV